MKFSNFKPVLVTQMRNLGIVDKVEATIDVTTGSLWWKKTETKTIVSRMGIGPFFFKDTGKFTPGFEVDDMAGEYRRAKLDDDWLNFNRNITQ